MNKITLSIPFDDKDLKMGQFFLRRDEGEETVYILAIIHGAFVLINLNTGCFFTSPHDYADEAFSDKKHQFSRITQPFTVTPES